MEGRTAVTGHRCVDESVAVVTGSLRLPYRWGGARRKLWLDRRVRTRVRVKGHVHPPTE